MKFLYLNKISRILNSIIVLIVTIILFYLLWNKYKFIIKIWKYYNHTYSIRHFNACLQLGYVFKNSFIKVFNQGKCFCRFFISLLIAFILIFLYKGKINNNNMEALLHLNYTWCINGNKNQSQNTGHKEPSRVILSYSIRILTQLFVVKQEELIDSNCYGNSVVGTDFRFINLDNKYLLTDL